MSRPFAAILTRHAACVAAAVLLGSTSSAQSVCPGTDPVSDIDIMVAYTPAAKAVAGGEGAMITFIYKLIEATNAAYLNSVISQKLRLVHMHETPYVEGPTITADLDALTDPADGLMDEIHPLRDLYGADAVILLVARSMTDPCGVSHEMDVISSAMAPTAFGVVRYMCALGTPTTPMFSFAHELGHIMGARHDRFVQPDDTELPFAHGYWDPIGTLGPFRTIMSYPDGCMAVTGAACPRINFYSNPDNLYIFSPTGVPDDDPMSADNTKVLNTTAGTVANFRCSSPGTGHVWMKDTWDDTGLEPDFHTDGEFLFGSPYLWVRTGEDLPLLMQHEHENPVAGALNHIYVKIQNGMDMTSEGTLKVYYANASTGIAWPINWTEIGGVPVSIPAHSPNVAKIDWVAPGPGHYCLLARYEDPADPFAFPETADTVENTKKNNKIIWHNVNVVALGSPMGPVAGGVDDPTDVEQTVSFIVRNVNNFTTQLQLELRSAPGNPTPFIFAGGEILLDLNDPLFLNWPGTGAGFTVVGPRLIQMTNPNAMVLTNIRANPRQEGNVRLTFRRHAQMQSPEYVFNVLQIEMPAAKLTGGIRYNVLTGAPEPPPETWKPD